MWRQFAKQYLPFWAAYFIVGWWVGSKLVAIPNLQPFKVLNIIGLTADLAGIIILSRLISQNPRYQALITGKIADNLYGFFFSSAGLLFRSLLGPSGPSSAQLESLSVGTFFYLVSPIAAYFPTISEHVIARARWSDERKTAALGGTLLVLGVIVQIWAAYLDLHS